MHIKTPGFPGFLYAYIFLFSLSVFICVHLWLKLLEYHFTAVYRFTGLVHHFYKVYTTAGG